MVVYFLTKQPELCNLICDELKKSFHVCRVFTDPDEYYATVKVLGSTKVDLLAVDYRMFDHDFFDPYSVLLYEKLVIPLIYYNDPYPELSELASFWKVKNKSKLEDVIDESTIEKYMPVFLDLQRIIQSKEINPFISTVCRPLKYEPADENCFTEMITVENYRKKMRIPESRFNLLKYLYENRNVTVTAEEICLSLWNEYSERTKQMLYSYIHDLRRILENDSNAPYIIKRNGPSSYILKIKCSDRMKNDPANAEYRRIKFKKIDLPSGRV